MKNYRAKRLSLIQTNIYDDCDQLLSLISWPNSKIWNCENASIGDPYFQDKSLGAYPLLTIKAMKQIARRKLLNNKFFGDEYEISLWNENGDCKISAYRPNWIWKKTEIKYNGQIYFLFRMKLFRFHFILQNPDGSEVIRFTELTSFFTFSSYREFLLSQSSPADPILLTFSFFLAHNEFF